MFPRKLNWLAQWSLNKIGACYGYYRKHVPTKSLLTFPCWVMSCFFHVLKSDNSYCRWHKNILLIREFYTLEGLFLSSILRDQPRQHIKKQRHYFCNKGPSSQGYGFPVVMCGCESWTVKKAEQQRIDAFELWCWRRLLSVPWTARRSNQSFLKYTSLGVRWKDWCWGWNSNTLATSCEELAHCKRPWCWEGLWAGGEGDDRGWDGWMASPTQCTSVWVNSRSWWWTGSPSVLWIMRSQGIRHDWAPELNWYIYPFPFEPPSHLPPHPTPLGRYRAPVEISLHIQQIPFGYIFYIW